MAITDYTTANSIRAALGVSDDELEDSVLEDQIYSIRLDEALYDLSPDMAEDYADIKALSSPSKDQTRFINLVTLWATYTVSNDLLDSLPMFAPQKMQSDKDSQERVADPYKHLRDNLGAMISSLVQRILALYATLVPGHLAPTAPTRTMVAVVGLGTDPVTG